MKTQVVIIGAGPAGLLLARMLQNVGIECVILERRSREYVLSRIRAGVLEPGTVETFTQHGLGERLHKEGQVHQAATTRWNGEVHRIEDASIGDRRAVTYGQSEIVRDMIELREADALPIYWEAEVTTIDDVDAVPFVRFGQGGRSKTLAGEFIAGCDGYRGVARRHIPGADAVSAVIEYPFAWLGILAAAAPNPKKRGHAHHVRGGAVASARSSDIGRLYFQVPRETNPKDWTDDAIWDELDCRLEDGSPERLNRGPIIRKDLALLRGFICKKMRNGRLFLAGDAAHVVPPSGAKGLNLAVGDARVLFEAISRNLRSGATEIIESYSEICLRRILPTMHWSHTMCRTLHIFPGQTEFETEMQQQTLAKWFYTEAGQRVYLQSMLGLPYEY